MQIKSIRFIFLTVNMQKKVPTLLYVFIFNSLNSFFSLFLSSFLFFSSLSPSSTSLPPVSKADVHSFPVYFTTNLAPWIMGQRSSGGIVCLLSAVTNRLFHDRVAVYKRVTPGSGPEPRPWFIINTATSIGTDPHSIAQENLPDFFSSLMRAVGQRTQVSTWKFETGFGHNQEEFPAWILEKQTSFTVAPSIIASSWTQNMTITV